MALTKVASAGIVDDTIAESKLDIHAAPSGTDKYLKYTSNGMEWATVSAGGLSDIVSDTSPQLGGDLDTNSFEISLDDDHKIKWGDDNDLQIYHNGTDGYIKNTTGDTYITGSASSGTSKWLYIRAKSDEHSIICKDNAAVELYYDNSKKFETTSTGITVDGDIDGIPDGSKILIGTHDDMQLYHQTNASYIKASNHTIHIDSGTTSAIRIISGGSTTYGKMADFNTDGSVDLYHDNSKKFYTASNGCHFPDSTFMPDGHYAHFGDGNDLYIGHNGSHSYIQNGGDGSLYIRSNNTITLMDDSGSETIANFVDNGACELYYDNSKKFETHSTGASWSGDLTTVDGGVIKLGTGGDIQIYHDGSNSYIQNSTGNFQLTCDEFRVKTVTGTETVIQSSVNGDVQLFYDNVKKINSSPSGVEIHNDAYFSTDNGSAYFGASQDLRIFHDGTDSYITNNTGYFRIRDATNSRDIAKFHSTNSQEFYFNGSKKLEVTNTGISVTGSVTPTGGIYLGGSGGGNALNDYEKGTWTPGLANDSGTAFSATATKATYVKIGRLVNIFLYWSSMANIPDNGSSFQITGLPFTSDGSHHGWGQIGYTANFDASHWNPLATTSGTNIYFHKTGVNPSALNSDFDGCQYLILGLQYETAS